MSIMYVIITRTSMHTYTHTILIRHPTTVNIIYVKYCKVSHGDIIMFSYSLGSHVTFPYCCLNLTLMFLGIAVLLSADGFAPL